MNKHWPHETLPGDTKRENYREQGLGSLVHLCAYLTHVYRCLYCARSMFVNLFSLSTSPPRQILLLHLKILVTWIYYVSVDGF